MAIDTTSNTVTTKVQFILPLQPGVKGYVNVNEDAVTGHRPTNVERKEYDLQVENLRGKEDSVSLDTAGYQLYTKPTKASSFDDDAVIEREYYPEVIQNIKDVTGASRVVLFDHSTFSTFS
jgi:hypothetical protein